MSDCLKIEQTMVCVTHANGSTENVLLVREFGTGSNGQAVLARSHFTDVNGDHVTIAADDIVRLGACLACCGDVVISDVIAPGNKIATITLANGQTVDLYETITDMTQIYDATNGVKIGEYTKEDGTVVEMFAPKQSVDVNLTPITYVPTATGNTQNLGQVVVDPTGTVWIIDQEGDAQQMQMPAFKEQNRFYADPNGSDSTGTGANEKPFLTAQAAVDALGQADTAVLNEGTYGAVTMATQNTTISGASNGYSGLVNIASLTATASGTSVRAEGLTVVGNVSHTGTAPLYLNNVTVNGNYTSSSTAYTEIKDSRIQAGTISKTAAGALFIRDSQIGAASFTTAGSQIIMRDVAIDLGDCVTIGAGVVYSLSGVQGCVNIDPAAIPGETAAIAGGATAAAAEAAATTLFNNVRITNPDYEANPTKVLTYDTVTGEVEYSDFPITTPTTTSLTPVVYDGGWVGAQADVIGNLAKEVELSDGTILSSGLVTWAGHGLTVGETYYTSQSTAGAYVTPEPISGLSQALFTVIDANTIDIQVQEGIEVISSSGTGNPTFTQTVYVNATSPTTATIFDLANPPTTNDDALKADSNNIYIGSNGSTWTYNSATSTYNTYVYPTTVKHGVLAYYPAGQNIPNATVTNIQNLNTVTNTAGSGWNATTGVFTAQRAGWYRVTTSLWLQAGNWNAKTSQQALVAKNGSFFVSNYEITNVALTASYLNGTEANANVYLNVGDTLRPQAYQESGSAKLTFGGVYNTFSVVEIG